MARLRYLPQLDGLRAVAVTAVVVHHLVDGRAVGGRLGVVVFFVLSGFLITSLLQAEVAQSGAVDLARFSLRRLLRLYPPLVVAVVGVSVLAVLTGQADGEYVATAAVALVYATNLVMTAYGVFTGAWSHTWTLSLEEQFYLLWPLTVHLVGDRLRARRLLPLLAAVAAVAALAAGAVHLSPTPGSVVTNPLYSGGPLLAGCALALTRAWRRPATHLATGLAGTVLLVGAVVLAGATRTAPAAETVATAGSLLLLAHLVAGRSSAADVLSLRPLVWLGRHSYEVYLWHYPLVVLLAGRLDRWALVVVVVVGSLLAAWASRRLVSRPLDARFKPRLAGTVVLAPR